MSVTQDALGGWFFPSGTAEWTSLLAGSGIGNPVSVWSFQEKSGGGMNDSVSANGNSNLTASTGGNEAMPGWSRQAATPSWFNTANNNLNIAVSSSLLIIAVRPKTELISATGTLVGLGVNTQYRAIAFTGGAQIVPHTSGCWMYATNDSSAQPTGSLPVAIGQMYLAALQVNLAASSSAVVTEYEVLNQSPFTKPPNTGAGLLLGSALANTANVDYAYMALWQGPGSASELSVSQIRSIFNLMKYGQASQGVTRDTTSGWYLPKDPLEWAQLIGKTGLPMPAATYNYTESTVANSYYVLDSFYNIPLDSVNLPSANQSFPGWSRVALNPFDNNNWFVRSTGSIPPPLAILGFIGIPATGNVGAVRNALAGANTAEAYFVPTGSTVVYAVDKNDITPTQVVGAQNIVPNVHPVFLIASGSTATVVTDQEVLTTGSITLGASIIVPVGAASPGGTELAANSFYLYGAVWTGSLTVPNVAQAQQLIKLMQFGSLGSGFNSLMLLGCGV